MDYFSDINRSVFEAIKHGNERLCESLLLRGGDIDAIYHDYTPIRIAAECGQTKVAELLIKLGAKVHGKNSYGNSAIMIASRFGHCEIIELLLSRGASVDDKLTLTFANSLIIASQYGHVQAVEILLSKGGANIHDKTILGYSSIMTACIYNHRHVVDLLLISGANTCDKDRYGNTALSLTTSEKIKFVLQQWPFTMVILALLELHVYYQIDCSSISDLFLFLC